MLTVRAWRVIDAVLGDASVVDIQCYGMTPLVEHADRLRNRALALINAYPPQELEQDGWPPEDSHFDIPLDADDVALIVTQLGDAIELTKEILAEDDLDPDSRADQEAELVMLPQVLDEVVDAYGS